MLQHSRKTYNNDQQECAEGGERVRVDQHWLLYIVFLYYVPYHTPLDQLTN